MSMSLGQTDQDPWLVHKTIRLAVAKAREAGRIDEVVRDLARRSRLVPSVDTICMHCLISRSYYERAKKKPSCRSHGAWIGQGGHQFIDPDPDWRSTLVADAGLASEVVRDHDESPSEVRVYLHDRLEEIGLGKIAVFLQPKPCGLDWEKWMDARRVVLDALVEHAEPGR